jgi:hypothetical protein
MLVAYAVFHDITFKLQSQGAAVVVARCFSALLFSSSTWFHLHPAFCQALGSAPLTPPGHRIA